MAEPVLFVSPAIYTESGVIDGYLMAVDGRIAAVEPGPVPDSFARLPRVEAPECRMLPGLIDLHVHGFGGWSVESGAPEELEHLARHLAYTGVTAFCPTCAAVPLPAMEAAVVAVRDLTLGQSGGARSLGMHLEGPYLNPARRGAMRQEWLRAPDLAEMRRLLDVAEGTLRRVTVAPELPGALEMIRYLAAEGIAVSGGHTDATYEEMKAGIRAGIGIATHTFNAMRGLHHREPGAAGALLTDPAVICEAICDLRHVHPAILRLLLRAVGRDRVAVISDAVAPAGLPPGQYQMEGMTVRIDPEGFCRLPDGTLAGSTLPMLSGLRHLVEVLGIPLEDAWPMVSLVPARAVGEAGRRGSLRVGKSADLVLVDSRWQVQWVVVEGKIVRRPDDPPPAYNPAFFG
ncbi:MAG TPA: N-acetylglucosamine-6-phosphate deacetylase [Symbiobacteriaceae bacterium]